MAPDAPPAAGNGIRKPPTPVTCGGCAVTWSGVARAHCSACHQTFTGVRGFDLHRTADGDHGGCLDPATLTPRLTQRPDGMWARPYGHTDQEGN